MSLLKGWIQIVSIKDIGDSGKVFELCIYEPNSSKASVHRNTYKAC